MQTNINEHWPKLLHALGRLRDVRVVGLVLFAVVVVMMSWSGVKVIDTNYDLQKEIAGLEQQNQLSRLANANLQLSNQYYESDQYMEITARRNFGLALPGETILSVPKEVALANTVDMPDVAAPHVKEATGKQPWYQRNFQAWMNFMFHRTPATP